MRLVFHRSLANAFDLPQDPCQRHNFAAADEDEDENEDEDQDETKLKMKMKMKIKKKKKKKKMKMKMKKRVSAAVLLLGFCPVDFGFWRFTFDS